MGQETLAKPFAFSEDALKELKEKYSVEMKDADDNPIKICMALIFDAATQRDPAKRDEVSSKLAQFLMKPDGLVNLFLALIDFDTSSQQRTTHYQRFLAVGNIIACLPRLCTTYEQYCDNISRQLRPLLVHPINQYASLASIIINALLESPHARQEQATITKIIVNPILAPMLRDETACDGLSPSESIIAIHNLIQNHLPIKLFVGTFSGLLQCFLLLKHTSSHLKSYLRQSMIGILTGLKPGPACCLLEQNIFEDSNKWIKYKMMVSDDEISIKLSDSHEVDLCGIDWLVGEILDECNNELLTLEFFFHFQSRMWSSKDSVECMRCASLIEPLLTRTMEGSNQGDRQDLFTSMATNSQRSLELITRTLSNYLEFIQVNRNVNKCDNVHDIASPSLISCIDILEVLYSASQPKTTDFFQCRTLPVIKEIKNLLVNDSKTVNREFLSSISGFLTRFDSLRTTPTNESSEEEHHVVQKEHDTILRDLNDEIVPVRVHALIRLKQLVMANEELTLKRIPQLYPMVESSLEDLDSYVFLAGINLLAEMALRKTSDILPKLINLHSRNDLSTLQRINVGEVLARLTRRMNETTPHYAMQILSSLLESSSDQEEMIRVSSLTNIGFVAANLGNSLDKYIMDILIRVGSVLRADTIQVKCAAVDLLRTTLMALNKMNVQSLSRELTMIYKTMKDLKHQTLDENLCLQVALALDEIDRLAKDMLGLDDGQREQKSLAKTIKVVQLFK